MSVHPLHPSLHVSRRPDRETWLFDYVDEYGTVRVELAVHPNDRLVTETVLSAAAGKIIAEIRDGTARGERRYQAFRDLFKRRPLHPFTVLT